MTPAASIMGEILFIALVSDKHNGLTLKNVTEQVLKRRILAVLGSLKCCLSVVTPSSSR